MSRRIDLALHVLEVAATAVIYVTMAVFMICLALLFTGCAALTPAERWCDRECGRWVSGMYLSVTDGQKCHCVPLSRIPLRGW